MVVAMDDSEHSTHAPEWTLNHFFVHYASNSPFKLVIVHAKSSSPAISLSPDPIELVIGRIGFVSMIVYGSWVEVLLALDVDSKTTAACAVTKAKKICKANSVNDAVVEVVAGDVRNVLCNSVRKHKASVLVSGSRGWGVLKRAVLGSVSDDLVHHAQCTLMIVKRPKIKH
ncbi:hypothetical protein FNV43_RR11627 [Rhamnella rubrinervis]|uniref:UspA domain-containing protein n=1 Tax=Rhamnella rubrinervis TaxID=2594499 RepID=A0A8K0H6D8_9ROSA|nr:hypothetical protein FNV43_RR11627 [Rhamnella rubrinervis]